MYTITKQELLGLEAHIQLECNNISRFNHYAQQCQDQQLVALCQQIATKRIQALQMLTSSISVTCK